MEYKTSGKIQSFVVCENGGCERTITLEDIKKKDACLLEPAAVYAYLYAKHKKHIHASKEHFLAVYLDTRRRVIKSEVVAIGTLDSCLVHPREVFRPAIKHNASALVVVHNHPSGDPEPSAEDLVLTRRLDSAASLLGISLLDHLVCGQVGTYVSIRERQRNGRLSYNPFA